MSQDTQGPTKDVISAKIRSELEKLTGSIDLMMENIRKMEHPILESRERLPEANQQLDKVSAQTEEATHRMLDMVEQIIDHQEKIVAFSQEVATFLKKSRSKKRDEMQDKVKRVNEMASTSQSNAFLIMDALQFQDITSQQMHHASSLLEDIERKLHALLRVFEGEEAVEIEDNEIEKKVRAYDPNADVFGNRDQKEVDEIVSQASETRE